MRVVPLLVIITWFSRGEVTTFAKALPDILQMQAAGNGGSGNRNEKCHWLKLMWSRQPDELTVNTEALFEVGHGNGRTFDASEFKNCTLKSAAVLSSSPTGVLAKAQAVRLTKTINNTIQIIISGELIIRGDDRRYLLLISLECGKRQFCIRFPSAQYVRGPGASWRATPRYLTRKFLSVQSEQSEMDDYQHHAMIVLVVVAGVIVLIITGAICVCGGEETTSPPARLVSLSQRSLSESRTNSFGDIPSNPPTHMGSAADKNDVGNEKREEIMTRQESRVSARSDDGKQNNRAAENDIRSDVNGHSTDVAEHVGNGKANEHAEVGESGKSWTHSRQSKDGRGHSSSSDEPGEGQKERKSRKSKLSFLGKNKRPTLEAEESQGQTDDVQPHNVAADRPRVPTPQPEQHPRELPPPPSIATTGRNPHDQVDCDQYELVKHDKKRSASATAAEDSYETVHPRVHVVKEFGNVRPVSTDSTCTYDSVGEGQSSRASGLYEVVDMEVRADATGDELENDTYEVVGGDQAVESDRGLSSADTYEEVIRKPAADPVCGELRQNSKGGETKQNETDEVDPKYSKVRQLLNIDTDELDPKYSKVRHCRNAKEGGEAKSDSAVGNGAKPQVKETEVVLDSFGRAPVNQDETYEEVKKDHEQEGRSHRSALADRPPLLKHSSTPELACGGSAKSLVSQRSNAPPAPSLNHLKEVAEASRPRALTEISHSQELHRRVTGEDVTVQRPFSADQCADEEVAQMFEYQYAKVDLTKKTRLSHEYHEEGRHHEGNGDTDSSGDDPPALPPIYISTRRTEEEEGSSEERRTTPVKQKAKDPSDSGIYDEISPSPSSSVVNKVDDVPQSARVVSTCSVDSDYETVEELMKYTSNAAAPTGNRSSKGEHETGSSGVSQSNTKHTEVSSDYETVSLVHVTTNTEVDRSSAQANVQETLPDEEPHYEPVEVRNDSQSSSDQRAGDVKK